MRTSTKETDLVAGKHAAAPGETGAASIARRSDPFASVKLDLAVLVLFATVAAPLVIWLVPTPLDLVLLGGYGAGAAIWVHCRVRGVFAAAWAARMDRQNDA